MKRDVDIVVRHAESKISAESVRRILYALDEWKVYQCPKGNLSVAFLCDKQMKLLHKDYLGDSSVTDVITFQGEEHPEEPFAGEICINIDQARRVSEEQGVTLATELRLYIVHGWLHLAGLRDGNRKDVAAMRVGENLALAYLDSLRAFLRVNKLTCSP